MANKFRIPGLQVPTAVDGEVLAFFNAVKERLELMGGERGDPEQRTVSLRELKEIGVAGIRTSNQFARLVAPRTPESDDDSSQQFEELDFSLFPQVNLAEASGELQFLVQGTTTADRFRLLVGDMLAIFGRLDQESAPQFPWSFEAEGYGLDITGIAPRFRFVEQAEGDDAEDVLPDDSALWDSIADAGVFEFRLRDDDDETGTTVYAVGRTGLNPDFFNVYADVLGIPVDGSELQIGAGADLRLFHDGTDSFITNDTGDTIIESTGGDHRTLAAAIIEDAVTNFVVGTDSIERLDIDASGAWNLAGDPGDALQTIVSNGVGLPPTWQYLLFPADDRGASWVSSSGALTSGVNVVYRTVPYAGTITNVRLLTAGGTGSCVVDVRKGVYASFPTVSSITAAAKPTISSGIKYEDSTLTGWITSVSAGDILAFVLESTSTFTQISIELEIQP